MYKLLKIFCFCGLFCLWNCCKNSIHPNLINKKVCKQILIKNYFDDNKYIINDDISIQELYELLQNATLCDIIKLPPRLVLTIKGTNYHQTFFISNCSELYLHILLSGKTNNVVKDGLKAQ